MYYTKETKIPAFVPLPLFMLKKSISAGAKIAYSFLLYRMLLSQKNGWADEEGHVFVIYPIKELAKDMGRSERNAKKYLGELSEIGCVSTNRRGCRPNTVYLMAPDDLPEELFKYEVSENVIEVSESVNEVSKLTLQGIQKPPPQEVSKSVIEVSENVIEVSKSSPHPIEENTKRKYMVDCKMKLDT